MADKSIGITYTLKEKGASDITRALQRVIDQGKSLRAETARLKGETSSLSAGWSKVDAALAEVGSTADLAGSKVAEFYADVRNSQVQQADNDLRALRGEILAVGDAAEKTSANVTSGAGSGSGGVKWGRGGPVTALARGLNTVGLGEPLMITDDIMDAKEALGELGPSMVGMAGGAGKLALGLGAAGIAVGAGILAYKAISDSTKEAAAESYAYVKALEEVSHMTAQQTQEKIDGIKQEIIFQQNLLNEARRLESEAGGGEGNTVFGKAGYAIREFFDGTAQGYGKFADETEKKVQELQIQYDALTGALGSGVTATNDAAAAEEWLKQKRIEQTNQIIQVEDERVQKELALYQELKTATVAGTQEKIDLANYEMQLKQNEVDSLRGMYESGSMTYDEFYAKGVAVNEEIFDLQERIDDLTNVVMPAAQAAEQQAQAEKARADAIKDATSAIEDAAKKAAGTAKLQTDYADQTEKIELDRQTKETQAQIQHNADLAAIDEKYYADQGKLLDGLSKVQSDSESAITKAARDSAREGEKAAREHNRRMLDVQRGLNDSLDDAVENRDVTAAIKAVRAAKRQAEDEQGNYDEQKRQRDESLAIQIEDLKVERGEKIKSAQKALDDLRASHAKERSERIAAFNTKLSEQHQAQAVEDNERRVAFNNQMTVLSGHHAAVSAATAQHQAQLSLITMKGMGSVQSSFSLAVSKMNADMDSFYKKVYGGGSSIGSRGSGGGGGTGGTYDVKGMKAYGSGGFPEPGSWGIVGDRGPEPVQFLGFNRILPNSALKGMGDTNITIHAPYNGSGDGMTPARYKEMFKREIIPDLVTQLNAARPVAGVG